MFHAVRLKVLALGRESVNQGQCLWGSENSCRTEVAVGAGVTGWVAMILLRSGGVFGFLAATRSIEEGFLHCASRLLRGSEAERKMRRLASVGMTGLGGDARFGVLT
jgi:hypothetical protein